MNEESPDLQLTPAVIAFIDNRIHAAMLETIQKIKFWAVSTVLGMFLSVAVGCAIMIFQLGQISEQFQSIVRSDSDQNAQRGTRSKWVTRKDAMDESIAHFLAKDGYVPPAWFKGRDAEELGVE